MKDKIDMDIMKNLRTIEWLKSEILMNIAKLYELHSSGEKDTKDEVEDLISNIILLSCILGRRLGLSYEDINSNLEDKIKLNLLEDHKIEQWYGDLSLLLSFIRRG